MIHLQGPQMLKMLEKSLRNSLPEALKVYGTVFHMNQGNPFNLKALVDKWPDFETVVIRPQEQEMTDDLDHYTNTYQIYSKNPKKCQEFLGLPEVINWKQHLQIQSSQSSLHTAIENLAAINSGKVKQTQNILYATVKTAKELIPSILELRPFEFTFKHSSLDITHAALVNKFWLFGGNEKSQRFIERCLRAFRSFCLLGAEGTPVCWSLMDQTGETRMAATVPEYRNQGLVTHIIYTQVQALEKLGFPLYSHVAKNNDFMQRANRNISIPLPCDWNQWNYVPL
uniref:Glycine N-acyltransferase-like protein n=1 Tax=Prolemur simus TaxID=1328070 RepID=A0A8C9AGP9_PROSS